MENRDTQDGSNSNIEETPPKEVTNERIDPFLKSHPNIDIRGIFRYMVKDKRFLKQEDVIKRNLNFTSKLKKLVYNENVTSPTVYREINRKGPLTEEEVNTINPSKSRVYRKCDACYLKNPESRCFYPISKFPSHLENVHGVRPQYNDKNQQKRKRNYEDDQENSLKKRRTKGNVNSDSSITDYFTATAVQPQAAVSVLSRQETIDNEHKVHRALPIMEGGTRLDVAVPTDVVSFIADEQKDNLDKIYKGDMEALKRGVSIITEFLRYEQSVRSYERELLHALTSWDVTAVETADSLSVEGKDMSNQSASSYSVNEITRAIQASKENSSEYEHENEPKKDTQTQDTTTTPLASQVRSHVGGKKLPASYYATNDTLSSSSTSSFEAEDVDTNTTLYEGTGNVRYLSEWIVASADNSMEGSVGKCCYCQTPCVSNACGWSKCCNAECNKIICPQCRSSIADYQLPCTDCRNKYVS
jgi:hypothetical protein